MRPADPHHGVGDTLQADVMRFMAIIAFCLIAILALVRSVEPAAPAAASNETPVPPPMAQPREAHPSADTSQQPAVAAATDEAPEPAAPEPAAQKPAAPKRAALEVPEVAEVANALQPEPSGQVSAPLPARVPQRPPAPADAPARPQAQEEGLSLRFASDQDFLRLVSRGRIQVFAFNGERVLRLGDDFRFTPAAAPGRVHELLPDTIPDLMLGALEHGDAAGYRWGIAMPERMARQVRNYVDQAVTGELVIDRFGEVRLHGGA